MLRAVAGVILFCSLTFASAVPVEAPAKMFTATAYALRGRTATGQLTRKGIISADRRVLPMGTKVHIEAGKWSGVYTVADTGGAIRGNRIDLWVPTVTEARKFGRRKVKVRLL
jgi:3D (Asp-Asp-Asp) domain-containing protein